MSVGQEDSRAGPIVLGLGVMVPGLIVSGFMDGLNVLPLAAWAAIAAVSGAVGIALQTRRRYGLSAALGAVGGAGSLWVVPQYVAWREGFGSTFFTAEFLLPMAVVGLPLLGVWHVAERYLPGE